MAVSMAHIEDQTGNHDDDSAHDGVTPDEHAHVLHTLLTLLRVAGRELQRDCARVDELWLRHHRERMLERLRLQTSKGCGRVERWLQSHWDRLVTRYGKRRVQQVGIMTLLVVTIICGPLSILATVGIFRSFAQTPPGSPNIIDPSAGTQSTIHLPPQPTLPAFQPLSTRPAMPHVAATGMQPGSLTLDPNNATQFVGATGGSKSTCLRQRLAPTISRPVAEAWC